MSSGRYPVSRADRANVDALMKMILGDASFSDAWIFSSGTLLVGTNIDLSSEKGLVMDHRCVVFDFSTIVKTKILVTDDCSGFDRFGVLTRLAHKESRDDSFCTFRFFLFDRPLFVK